MCVPLLQLRQCLWECLDSGILDQAYDKLLTFNYQGPTLGYISWWKYP